MPAGRLRGSSSGWAAGEALRASLAADMGQLSGSVLVHNGRPRLFDLALPPCTRRGVPLRRCGRRLAGRGGRIVEPGAGRRCTGATQRRRFHPDAVLLDCAGGASRPARTRFLIVHWCRRRRGGHLPPDGGTARRQCPGLGGGGVRRVRPVRTAVAGGAGDVELSAGDGAALCLRSSADDESRQAGRSPAWPRAAVVTPASAPSPSGWAVPTTGCGPTSGPKARAGTASSCRPGPRG